MVRVEGMLPLIAVLAIVGCQEGAQPTAVAPGGNTPAVLTKGEALFNVHCAVCHGPRATGTDHGPPLVDQIYQPSHHADANFQLAVRNGARAHHWSYGNMPPISDVSEADVNDMIGYVRWLQRQAGIF